VSLEDIGLLREGGPGFAFVSAKKSERGGGGFGLGGETTSRYAKECAGTPKKKQPKHNSEH